MSLDTQNTGGSLLFAIPEELDQKVPCQVNPQLFDDPALDIDLAESEWISLSGEQQRLRVEAKTAAEQRAIAACATCPLLKDCKTWALTSGVEIYGVVGGTTPEERKQTSTRRVIDDPGVVKRSKLERDELISELMDAGIANKVIADRLGCSVRTVERRKSIIRAQRANSAHGDGARPADSTNSSVSSLLESMSSSFELVDRDTQDSAANELTPGRVTKETAAIFDALADGSVRDRNALIESLLHVVSEHQALTTAPKNRAYASEEEKIAAGARKFLMNRLDIAMRRGRVRFLKAASGDILVGLDAQTASVWSAYRSTSAA